MSTHEQQNTLPRGVRELAAETGLVGPFASWAAILIEPTQKFSWIAEDAHSALEAQNHLARVGLTDVIGYALGGTRIKVGHRGDPSSHLAV